ncbi:MAG: hypothetical protein K1X74_07920 [Pirellulales bacterium]|nr:hypothetical protein [Pirellulales bacterium]
MSSARIGLMRWFVLLAACLPVGIAPAQEPVAEKVSFSRQIAPLLIKHCQGCHGPQEPKGEYQLHNFERLTQNGYSGSPVVTAGKPEESELYNLLVSEDADVRMPKEGEPLPAEAIALVKRWIEEGAAYDAADPKVALASIAPRNAFPAAPATYRKALPITALAFNPAGTELAASGYHEVTIWNPNDGQLVRRIGDVAQRVYGLEYSPDGKLLAVASGTPASVGEVKLYDAATGASVRVLATLDDVAFHVAFSPDGTRLAASGGDRTIRVFDVATGRQEALIEDHADWVLSIAWSPDGAKLVSASRDKTSKLFDAKTGESLLTYPGHGDVVYAVQFNADGTQIFSAGRDRKIHVWNPADGAKIAEIGGFGLDVYALARSGNALFSGSADKSVRQHKADDRAEVRVFAGHADWVYCLSYNEATKRLASGGYDGEVRVWNADDGALIVAFKAVPPAPATEQAAAQ